MTTTEAFKLESHSGQTAEPTRYRAWSLATFEPPYSLTEPELDVLYHLKEGLYEDQIALTLGVPASMVQCHTASVIGKMNARSRTEAAVRAIKEGIFRRQ
ncbi:MAG TPA: LuxR C-terminal-related transcriptional regulator [Dehalococcoidia bacterium]|jgi:DNA-binding NarL/FixJ family response regulator